MNMSNQTKATPSRLIRCQEVTHRIGISKATVYNWINAGRFPKPIELGGGRVAWLEEDIDLWIDQRLTEAGR